MVDTAENSSSYAKIWKECQESHKGRVCTETCFTKLAEASTDSYGERMAQILHLLRVLPKKYIEAKTRSSTAKGVMKLMTPINAEIAESLMMNIWSSLGDVADLESEQSILSLGSEGKAEERSTLEAPSAASAEAVPDSIEREVEEGIWKILEALEGSIKVDNEDERSQNAIKEPAGLIKAQIESLRATESSRDYLTECESTTPSAVHMESLFDLDIQRDKLAEIGWEKVRATMTGE